jgi:succinate dehydrogenase/fumarate reductase-like Fe-S protein
MLSIMFSGTRPPIWLCAGIAKLESGGSCSAEVNGRPRLTCKTRMDALPQDQPVTILSMKSFPVIKDLVTDVSWNYKVNKKIPAFHPRPGSGWKMRQEDTDRVQEFRKCIECFLWLNVCHVLREHGNQEQFGGPRFFVRVAALEMHPLDDVAPRCSRTNSGSVSATSLSAVLKSAPKASASLTTLSFRLRREWWMSSTIPCSVW